MASDTKYEVNAGFFDAIDEDRVYSADDMNRPYRKLISNGVFATPQGEPSTYLQVLTADNEMNVVVSAGCALIGDKWFENPSDMAITIQRNTAVLSRIDSIIAQVDKTQTGRVGNIVYRQGIASSNPVHPDINTEDDIAEFRLADITISPSCVKITQDLITDCRGSDECPWVTSLIYQVDTSTLYVQWQEAYQKYYDDQKEEFNAWFQTIKDILSENVAGNLQLEIDDINEEIKRYSETITTEEEIPENTDYTIPLYYQVGNNSLSIFYQGEKLIKNIHYKEIGSDGEVSNIIQFYDWGESVPIDRTIEFVVLGYYDNKSYITTENEETMITENYEIIKEE